VEKGQSRPDDKTFTPRRRWRGGERGSLSCFASGLGLRGGLPDARRAGGLGTRPGPLYCEPPPGGAALDRVPTSKAAGVSRATSIPAPRHRTPGPGSRD